MRQISLTAFFATVFILLYEIAKLALVAILVLALVSPLFVAVPALADQLGDREPRDDGELIDLMWWYRGAGIETPFWETSSFWGDVWRVVGTGEWWR